MLAQPPCQLHRLIGRPAALGPVRRRNAHKQRQMIRPRSAHSVGHLEQQPDAIVEAAAVPVGALVGKRRQEFVQQVAVRRVNLNKIESSLVGAPRRIGKCADYAGNFCLIQCLRHRIGRRKRESRLALPAPSVLPPGSAVARRQTARSCCLCAPRAPAERRPARPASERSARSARASGCARLSRCPGRLIEMRPSGVTAEASVITSPAPPCARRRGEPGASHWRTRPATSTRTSAKRQCDSETQQNAAEKAKKEDGS